MFPVSRRELTPVRLCSVRLSWRQRARPSTTLHEIQICPKANWNMSVVAQRWCRCKFYERDGFRQAFDALLIAVSGISSTSHVMSDLTDQDSSVRNKRLADGATRKEFNRPGAAEHLASLPPATAERSPIVKDAFAGLLLYRRPMTCTPCADRPQHTCAQVPLRRRSRSTASFRKTLFSP